MGSAETPSTLTPEFYWAQRKDLIFLSINVPNVQKDQAEFKLTDDGRVYFKGVGGQFHNEHEYLLDVQLYKPIKASESQCNIGARLVQFKIQKSESGPYWPYLLKEKKNVHCKIDWDHWKDEDEEDDYDFGKNWNSKDMADLDFGDSHEDSSDSDEEGGVKAEGHVIKGEVLKENGGQEGKKDEVVETVDATKGGDKEGDGK